MCPTCSRLELTNPHAHSRLETDRFNSQWNDWGRYLAIRRKDIKLELSRMRGKLTNFNRIVGSSRSYNLLRQNKMSAWFRQVAPKRRDNPHAEHYDENNNVLGSTAARHRQTEHVHTEWCR